ncbi:MAG TPA: hypothetical protein VHG08_08680 [Longimicrobium sp.]|nr:hypothetical protein [Longimicrobium sp.]
MRLTVDGQAQTQEFRVVPDPRSTATPADLEAQFALAMRVRDRTSDANRGVIRIRGIRAQVQDRLGQTQDARIRALADSMMARLTAIKNELYQTRLQANQDPLNFPIRLNNKLAALLGVIESAEAAPTRQTYQVLDELSARLDVQLAALNAVVTGDLPRLNALLRARRLRPIDPDLPPPPPPADERREGEDDAEEGEEGEEREW